MAEHEYAGNKKKQLDIFQQVGEMLLDFDPDCKLNLKGSIFDLGSIEYNIEGAGYGDLVNLFYKAVTLNMQQDLVSRIVEDFKESNAPKDEPMGEPMEDPKEGDMMWTSNKMKHIQHTLPDKKLWSVNMTPNAEFSQRIAKLIRFYKSPTGKLTSWLMTNLFFIYSYLLN